MRQGTRKGGLTIGKTQKSKLLPRLGEAGLLLGAIVFFAAAWISDFRDGLRETLQPEFRKVLSTVDGDIFGPGQRGKVLKIQTREGLFVEVYRSDDEGNFALKEKFKLADKRDGYFVFNGEASNLVLDDIDGDRKVEIIVPSFDSDLVAHLNIYSYKKDFDGFIRLNQ